MQALYAVICLTLTVAFIAGVQFLVRGINADFGIGVGVGVGVTILVLVIHSQLVGPDYRDDL